MKVHLVYLVTAPCILFFGCTETKEQPTPTSTPTATPTATPRPLPTLTLQTIEPFGDVYYDLTGPKGLILCFHGTGGSANGWSNGDKFNFLNALHIEGYAIVCPTSKNRSSKQWDLTDSQTNPDVVNVDVLLHYLGIPITNKIFIVGHSNGGGFTPRYANNSERKSKISGIQVSNHPGSSNIYSNSSYTIPTIFNYADCDPIINASNVRNSINILKQRGLSVLENDLDPIYTSGNYSDCHEFIDTSSLTKQFFETQ